MRPVTLGLAWLTAILAAPLVLALSARAETTVPVRATPATVSPLAGAAAPPPFDAARLSHHIQTLASDAFEGRAPGTAGEAKTVAYIQAAFAEAGLQPGAPNDAWVQPVRLNRFTRVDPVDVTVAQADKTRALAFGTDMVVQTRRPQDEVRIEAAPLVFVGYGVSDPARGWDDYKGVDLTGKIAIVLVNDPDFATPEPGAFGGKAMAYVGRWTYKYDELARRGAAGALIVHEDEPAAYGWRTVLNSWAAPQFDVVRPSYDRVRLPVEGWLQRPVAAEVLQGAGLDLERLKKAAQRADFVPVTLPNSSISVIFKVKAETLDSANVVGKVVGAERPNETVVITAHWDHLGRGEPDPDGDDIFNGAVDNATGVAGLIELGRRYAAQPPARTMVFLAVTAEEKGLLGSEFYALNPLYPLETTAAGFNMDAMNVTGPSRDVTLVGRSPSNLEPILAQAVARQNRTLVAERRPQAGSFFRSDHFSLALRGVPVIYFGSGADKVDGGVEAGEAASKAYTRERYHQQNDEWSADWDLRGMVQDLDLIYAVARAVADGQGWPEWAAASEFKPVRDQSAAARR